ncbi:MAG: hypothetical protein RMM08_09330, partial [Armatimonadota bacterium]|nr:hypothetical protein [Armatimonadota bacterium]
RSVATMMADATECVPPNVGRQPLEGRAPSRPTQSDGSAGASPSNPSVTLSVSEGSQMLRLRLSRTEHTPQSAQADFSCP